MARAAVRILTGELKIFAEGLLRFRMPIAVTFIEGVGAVADYVRAQADCVAAFFARPALRASKKMQSDLLRPITLVDNKPANFRSRVCLHHATHIDSQPAGHFAAELRDENCMVVRVLYAS
jgi:hypothetical protein